MNPIVTILIFLVIAFLLVQTVKVFYIRPVKKMIEVDGTPNTPIEEYERESFHPELSEKVVDKNGIIVMSTIEPDQPPINDWHNMIHRGGDDPSNYGYSFTK